MSNDSDRPAGWQFWVDRGGTFTDVVARDPGGSLHVRKLRSDAPDLYDDAAVAAIAELIASHPARIDAVRLGTTVATNALLEGEAPPMALLVNEGFADLLDIADQRRPDLFALEVRKRRLPLRQVVTTPARIDADGTPLADHECTQLATTFAALRDAGITHLAISLLHNWRYPSQEQEARALAEAAGFDTVVCSHETAPVEGYLARTETTVVDTWLTPVLQAYLQRFRAALASIASVGAIQFMQSHGGLADARQVRGKDAVLSGPAGGLIGLARAAERLGLDAVIGIDMGGTSTDLCHWRGTLEQRSDNTIGSFRLHSPMLRLNTIASGGGSRVRMVDGRLAVGPASAGAQPGPAAYGAGGPATLTDANVVLGRLPAEHLPAVFGADGRQPLDANASTRALAEVLEDGGKALAGYDVVTLAQRSVDLAVDQVAGAVRKLALQHGSDLRQFTLAAFGGAAGQIACAVADALELTRVWLHPAAGVLSALGIGLADERSQQETTINQPLHTALPALSARIDSARALLAGDETLEATLVLRPPGTEVMLPVAWGIADDIVRRFDSAYRQRFGVAPGGGIEVAALRLATLRPGPAHPDIGPGDHDRTRESLAALRIGEAWVDTPVTTPDALTDQPRRGPLIVVADHTTLVVEPGWQLERNAQGHLLLSRESAPAQRALATAAQAQAVDPALLDVFNRRFTLVAEHMGHVLAQTAHSVNIRERLDFSCALFSADGALIANAPHMPVHLGSMGDSVRHIHTEAEPRAGDVWLVNSPYAGGTHLPDITAVMPWHDEAGVLRFYLASRAHHADVGGITPGSMPADSTDIAEEGVLFDAVLMVRDGEWQEQDLRRRLADGRWPARAPERNLSDLRAQLAALAEGERQLDALCTEFGVDTVASYMGHVFDNARAAIAAVIRDLTPASASVTLDNGCEIVVALKPQDGHLKVDFSGSAAQHDGNFNAPRAVSRAAVLYALRVLCARDIPLNDGCLADVTLNIPARSLLDPAPPAAVVAGNVETSQAITNAVLAAAGALAHAQGTMNNLTFGNATVQYYETIGGGSGAGNGFAGASAVQTHMTNSRMTDTEVLESRLPVRVEAFSIRRGSGGEGRWPGGDGIRRRLRVLIPVTCSILSTNRTGRPAGLDGGDPGQPGINRVVRADGREEVLAGVARTALEAGDVIEILTPGGGGYGRR